MNKKETAFKLFKYITLIGYILCIIVLIVESCINGTSSNNQSNSIGNVLADILNELKGDQAKEIATTSISISNKIETAFVGDEYLLRIDTLPIDATNKALKYSTSNDVASVSNDGTIKFLKEGYTTITAYSEKYNHISDSFSVDVKSVKLESLTPSIVNETPDDNNIYTLTIGKTFSIKTTISPGNTTDRNLTYSLDNNSYIELSKNTIKVNNFSGDNVSTITVRQGNIYNTLKIKTTYENTQALSSYTIEDFNLYVGQTITPNVIPSPLNATFSNYTLSSSNNNVEILNNTIKGLNVGKTTIRASSIDYSNISKSIEIDVLPAPTLESFNFTFLDKLAVNNTFKLDILPTPSYASIPSLDLFDMSSSNEEVATINNGVITTLKEGRTNISLTYNNLCINKQLSVYTAPNMVGDLDISLIQKSLYTDKSYNLTDIIDSKFNNATSLDIYYSLKDDSTGKINNNLLTINKAGKVTLIVSHIPSGKYKEIDVLCGNDYKIVDENGNEITSLNLKYLEKKTFKIINDNNVLQNYKFNTTSKDVYIKNNGDTYSIKSLFKNGTTNITICPLIEQRPLEELSKNLTVSALSSSTTSLTYKLINASSGNTIIAKTEHSFRLPINGHYQIIPIIDDSASDYNFTFTSLNNDIATINDAGLITFHRIGVSTFTIKENLSSLSCQFDINVLNYIALIKDNNYTLSGKKVAYNETNKTYTLTNGYSAKFKVNFSPSSTFTDVKYKSSNEEVLNISNDGTITPLKAGKAVVSAIIDDGMSYYSIDLNIEVIRKDFVEKLDEFRLIVRKALGHFGAFFVFGILTTLTFIFFYKKSLKNDTIITLTNGILLASITEIIQLIVPGRSGTISDILINLSGFIIGFIIVYIILKLKKQITFNKEK